MDFFVDEKQRRASNSTCYFELQKGHYKDKCWLSDSISISAELWDEYRLSDLVHQVIKEFDYYGITVVTKQQWSEIKKIAQKTGGLWKEVIEDAVPWMNGCFEDYDAFTIIGI